MEKEEVCDRNMTQARLKPRYILAKYLGKDSLTKATSLSLNSTGYKQTCISSNPNLLHLCCSHSCVSDAPVVHMHKDLGSSSALHCVRCISISWPTYPGLHTSATHCARQNEWHLSHATAETTITMVTKTSLAGLQSFLCYPTNSNPQRRQFTLTNLLKCTLQG